jgi:hypothetical protein
MATTNKTGIQASISAGIRTGASDTTAAEFRAILNEILDSYANVIDGGDVYQSPVGYNFLPTTLGASNFINRDYADNRYVQNGTVNGLGLIQIVDLNGDLFNDLTSASAYIRTFIDENTYSITDESFINGVYFFTVPQNTEATLLDYFLGHITNPIMVGLIDDFGLITKFIGNAFRNNHGVNYLGNVTFEYGVGLGGGSNDPFHGSNCIVSIGDLQIVNNAWFARNSTGKFIFRNNIGSSEGVNFSNFFFASTSTVFVKAAKYTSNAGGIHGDVNAAITQGCNVQFDGINLVTLNTNQTLINKRVTSRVTTIVSSATPTINTDNCDAVDITALAAAITSMTTNLSGTPTNFQKLIIRIKDNGTARAITWGASFDSRGATLPTTTVLGKITTVGLIYNTTTSIWGCVAVAQEV